MTWTSIITNYKITFLSNGVNEINQNVDWLSKDITAINDDKIILMIPGVSKSGKDKQWSPDKFAILASTLEKLSLIHI